MLSVGTETWGRRREAVPQRRGLLPACSGGFSASHREWPWCHCSLTVNEGQLPKAPGLGDGQAKASGRQGFKGREGPYGSPGTSGSRRREAAAGRERPERARVSQQLGAPPGLLGKLTCREKARRAGMGISAAMKKAVTLLMEVRATLAPVRLRHSPVLS